MPKVVVIGAGFIGAEVAATCRGRGLDVTVLEALPAADGARARPGARRGDRGRCTATTASTCAPACRSTRSKATSRVERVRLGDGSAIEADVVVVGVGVVPKTQWLEGSGLTIDNGVVCDATCLAAPGHRRGR